MYNLGNDDIRVVRGNLGESRPRADIEMLIDITVKKPIFKYCLGRFNCEHFVNFIKVHILHTVFCHITLLIFFFSLENQYQAKYF
jgi:hypothetical protein